MLPPEEEEGEEEEGEEEEAEGEGEEEEADEASPPPPPPPSLVAKRVLKALAKLSPRSWLVPACRAFLSPIIASIVYVTLAPANDSSRDLRPATTGSAAASSANRS